MLKRIVQLAEGMLGIVGVRVGTEEPLYVSEHADGAVEIRRYGPRIAAQTTVDADDEEARRVGFRRLAGYIFGANQRRTRIAMTAPVAQRSEAVAMTAPVAQSTSVIRFFMPAKWSLATLPQPDSDTVALVEVPAETMAVLRFSGDRGPVAVATRTEELLAALRDGDIEPAGDPVAWFYDPPWTVAFRRRNEIAVRIG